MRVYYIFTEIGDFLKLKFPGYAQKVLKTLINGGYEAYFVGGCVRDMLLGTSPTDFDITTNASAAQIKALFEKTVDTGIKHGTVTVLSDNMPVEVTTYRIDGAYENHRKPKEVTFAKTLKEDVLRRDFTINAMAADENGEIVDLCGGKDDLEKRIIRTVGNPKERFFEDALRILRCIRFSAALGFAAEKETKAAALKLSHLLSFISAERIREEVFKILLSKAPEKIALLAEYDVAGVIDQNFHKAIVKNSQFLKNSRKNLQERLAILFFGFDFSCFSAKMKIDKKTEKEALAILNIIGGGIEKNKVFIKQLLSKNSEDVVIKSIYAQKSLFGVSEKDYLNILDEIKSGNECFSLRQLALSGRDIERLGLSGAEIGKALDFLLDFVIKFPESNNKETLIKIIKKR